MATAKDIARKYFPDVSEEELDAIIWGETGFPYFWPDDTKTPEENFRKQLQQAAGLEPKDGTEREMTRLELLAIIGLIFLGCSTPSLFGLFLAYTTHHN